MSLPIYQVDAFTDQAFGGNPAAVCPLGSWLPDATMQAIAAENNLSETAFFVPRGEGFELRWFTPLVEVDLCGHATLAAARIVLDYIQPETNTVCFQTRSGELRVARKGQLLELDLPAQPGKPCDPPRALMEGLEGSAEPREVFASATKYLAVFEHQKEVLAIKPISAKLKSLNLMGVIASAPGEDVDFVSRYFAPKVGILEDPVTGSAHCMLTPYWADELGKARLVAEQVSRRGGRLTCEHVGERVLIAGKTKLYLEGRITL